MSGNKSIKVTIANRVYPVSVTEQEEEVVRKAESSVNAYLRSLEDRFAVRDKQDLLAMTALKFAELSMETSENLLHDRNLATESLQEICARAKTFIGTLESE